jgi:hypothetical protein
VSRPSDVSPSSGHWSAAAAPAWPATSARSANSPVTRRTTACASSWRAAARNLNFAAIACARLPADRERSRIRVRVAPPADWIRRPVAAIRRTASATVVRESVGLGFESLAVRRRSKSGPLRVVSAIRSEGQTYRKLDRNLPVRAPSRHELCQALSSPSSGPPDDPPRSELTCDKFQWLVRQSGGTPLRMLKLTGCGLAGARSALPGCLPRRSSGVGQGRCEGIVNLGGGLVNGMIGGSSAWSVEGGWWAPVRRRTKGSGIRRRSSAMVCGCTTASR